MVQYGFPVPPTVPLARPLGESGASQNRISATAKVAVDGGASAAAGETAEGGEVRMQEWGEQSRRDLMDELFLRGQQRFAREAGSDNQQFEILVNRGCVSCTDEYFLY